MLCGMLISYSIQSQQFEDEHLIASDGITNDLFGVVVEYQDDFILVGALFGQGNHSDSGAAYIYEPNGTGWTESKIFASDGADGDRFGLDLDINVAKDRIVVGAGYDDGVGVDSGSIYVYDWNGTTWVETKIIADDESDDFKFGQAVAMNDVGDRIVVGSWSDTTNGAYSGSIYILDWDGTNWNQTKILASDGSNNHFFGVLVDISGDRILSSAWGDYSVYLYEWDGTNWNETKFEDPGMTSMAGYGQGITIDEDRFVVGAYLDDELGDNAGAVYVYDWDGTNWEYTKVFASDTETEDFFGKKVDYHDDVLIVAADRDSEAGLWTGSAYRMEYDGTTWNDTKFLPSDGEDFDDFGSDVVSKGGITIVGCQRDTENGSDSGGIYIYESTVMLLTWYEDADNDGFGNINVSTAAATQPSGYVADDTDCDDTDPLEFPGQIWYRDLDGDGYGSGMTITQCLRPSNYYVGAELIDTSSDCDDNDAIEFPGQTWYRDADLDGYSNGSTITQCIRPINYFVPSELISTTDDCNDNNSLINPGQAEVCDGFDNDCNDIIDDGCFTCDGINLVIPTIQQNTYRAEILLDSDAVANQTDPILFTAGDELNLEIGFSVEIGTEFIARIEGCQ